MSANDLDQDALFAAIIASFRAEGLDDVAAWVESLSNTQRMHVLLMAETMGLIRRLQERRTVPAA